jgi:hypothetical protein
MRVSCWSALTRAPCSYCFTADAGSLVNYVVDTAAATRLTDRFTQQVTKLWLLEDLSSNVPVAGTEPEPESQQAGDGLSVHVQRT